MDYNTFEELQRILGPRKMTTKEEKRRYDFLCKKADTAMFEQFTLEPTTGAKNGSKAVLLTLRNFGATNTESAKVLNFIVKKYKLQEKENILNAFSKWYQAQYSYSWEFTEKQKVSSAFFQKNTDPIRPITITKVENVTRNKKTTRYKTTLQLSKDEDPNECYFDYDTLKNNKLAYYMCDAADLNNLVGPVVVLFDPDKNADFIADMNGKPFDAENRFAVKISAEDNSVDNAYDELE